MILHLFKVHFLLDNVPLGAPSSATSSDVAGLDAPLGPPFVSMDTAALKDTSSVTFALLPDEGGRLSIPFRSAKGLELGCSDGGLLVTFAHADLCPDFSVGFVHPFSLASPVIMS